MVLGLFCQLNSAFSLSCLSGVSVMVGGSAEELQQTAALEPSQAYRYGTHNLHHQLAARLRQLVYGRPAIEGGEERRVDALERWDQYSKLCVRRTCYLRAVTTV